MWERSQFPYDPQWELDEETARWERRLRRKRAIGRVITGAIVSGAVLAGVTGLVLVGAGHGVLRGLSGLDQHLWEPTLADTRPSNDASGARAPAPPVQAPTVTTAPPATSPTGVTASPAPPVPSSTPSAAPTAAPPPWNGARQPPLRGRLPAYAPRPRALAPGRTTAAPRPADLPRPSNPYEQQPRPTSPDPGDTNETQRAPAPEEPARPDDVYERR